MHSTVEPKDLCAEMKRPKMSNGEEGTVLDAGATLEMINPGQPNVPIGTPPKITSGFPIKQWSKSSETPPECSPWVIRPR